MTLCCQPPLNGGGLDNLKIFVCLFVCLCVRQLRRPASVTSSGAQCTFWSFSPGVPGGLQGF